MDGWMEGRMDGWMDESMNQKGNEPKDKAWEDGCMMNE